MPAADSPLVQWNAPECPFAVCYLPRVVDDIRLAVVDAFFSLPRGGAEIGGLLLGRHEASRVAITAWQPLDCEHALGPSFTLSDTDRRRLAAMIAAAETNPDARPVGWYHSHTRSEIFLSDADLEIHRQFFPQPWQVALVLRPHTFNPTRGGFFFRGKDGAIRADASCLEFVLDPLPARPLPSREPAAPEPLAEQRRVPPAAAGPVIDVHEVDVTEIKEEPPAEVAEPAPQPAVEPPPSFLTAQQPARRMPWLVAAGVLLGVAAGAGAYQTRGKWLPPMAAWFHPAGPVAQTSVGLRTVDRDGQLQILWDGNSAGGLAGILLISDGRQARSLPLDAAHLRNGSLTYARQSERVDVTLTLNQPNGQKLVEAATFLGAAPPQPLAGAAAPSAPSGNNADTAQQDLQKQRDALAQENAQLKEQLASQAERIQRLQKSLDTAHRLLATRSRLRNQATGGAK
jgi:proteasome lid subunit RPN8/RPN11